MSFAAAFLALSLAANPIPGQGGFFQISVVDEQTGRGVPLVELRTVNELRFWTDSNGVVAFHEPGLMDQAVFFHVKSHGYEYPRDGFGYRGTALKIVPGGRATLRLKRLNIAERLYRVTGGGIYADSVLLGLPVSLRRPVLNGQVFGSDSVVNAVYRGKVFWFWGDTNRPSYPLGNFHVPGATSLLPAHGGLDPASGVDLEYFLDERGFARPTAPLPGRGPTWISGLVVLDEGKKKERLFTSYAKIRPPMETYERGLAEFDDTAKVFRKVVSFDLACPLYPKGHPFHHTVNGVDYIYYAHPFPLTRVRANAEQLQRPSSYEGFTCLVEGSRLEDGRIDREGGRARYAWKRNTPPVGPQEQMKLIQRGKIRSDEVLLSLCDVETGRPVIAHGGSVYWNEWRRRWVLVTVEVGGTSFLGEVWYAEADTPLGPWTYARKVATHDRYSFYNPKQHPFFDREGGRVIFFEGTYTHTFSGNSDPTPRYDYNQVMYRLDLADPRLALPVAIYSLLSPGQTSCFGTIADLPARQPLQPAFFALDRPGKGTVPVYALEGKGGSRGLTRVSSSPVARVLFHALPADHKPNQPLLAPLYELIHEDGRRTCTTDPNWSGEGFRRAERPFCLVWSNPSRAIFPRE
jgi:hypothetical protein